jgi:hypothetical protein
VAQEREAEGEGRLEGRVALSSSERTGKGERGRRKERGVEEGEDREGGGRRYRGADSKVEWHWKVEIQGNRRVGERQLGLDDV